MQDIEIICVTILNRLKVEPPFSKQWNIGARLDNILMQSDAMADFLAENLIGQKAVEFAIRFDCTHLNFFISGVLKRSFERFCIGSIRMVYSFVYCK